MTDSLNSDFEFRHRGADMTRLETFVDASFAFAVTLLVIGGGDSVPTTYQGFVDAMQQIPAFAVSFANIMLFWYAHHVWSRRFGLEDTRSILLSLVLVFIVLVYVYPLKAIYSGAMHFFSGGRLDAYVELSPADGDLRTMFIVFGIAYASLSAVIVLLNRHALKLADALQLSVIERFDTRTVIWYWSIGVFVPTLSIIAALVVENPNSPIAGFTYWLFAILFPIVGITRGKRRNALLAQSTLHSEHAA